MAHFPNRRKERGAVILTTALLMFFLLGFMGIALDFGRLFVVKSELQTAMDSCALAAAQELDGTIYQTGPDTVRERAIAAGRQAAQSNRVNLQSAPGILDDTEFTFRDVNYVVTTNGLQMRYVQCQHMQQDIRLWLMQALGVFSGNSDNYPPTRDVFASAVATRAFAQTACALPLGLRPKPGGAAPNYGYTRGEWVQLMHRQRDVQGGTIGWSNLDGSNSASETEAEINGRCGSRVGDTLGTPGVQASVVDAWNAKFGMYRNGSGPAENAPDFTGHVYTTSTWSAGSDAFADFMTRRTAYANCSNSPVCTANGFSAITAGAGGPHQQYGQSRRLVTIPVLNAGNQVIDYVCMLMLHPLPQQLATAVTHLEFRSNASAPDSPCTTNGIPGGTAGPLVPVLVR